MKITQKFGLPLAVFALATLALFSNMRCEKKFPEGTAELDKLPPATQTGAQTFGCLVNGKAFYPRKTGWFSTMLQCDYMYLSDNGNPPCYYFTLAATDSKTDPTLHKSVDLSANCTTLEEKTYVLDEDNTPSKLAGHYVLIGASVDNVMEYQTNLIQKGEVTITRFDNAHQIVSGTFWFDAINKYGDIVQVREGRFDVHLNYAQ